MKEYEVWARKKDEWILCGDFMYMVDANKSALSLFLDDSANVKQVQVRMFSGRILKVYG